MQQELYEQQGLSLTISRPWLLSFLAETYLDDEQEYEGLLATTEVLETVQSRGSHVYEAEAYRLKGELLLKQQRRSQGG